jgi:hypothetical protein
MILWKKATKLRDLQHGSAGSGHETGTCPLKQDDSHGICALESM